ncbi:DNA alkylation repair protein [Patescibacteria group bacterium]|nr:DNA alkylation repair protein [Patescibacteria group bacterium]
MTNLEKIILRKLKPHEDKKRAEHYVGYINSAYSLLGCNMPTIRRVAREIASEFDHLPWRQQRRRLTDLWKRSEIFDVLYVMLIIYSNRQKQNDLSDWRILKSWSSKIDNWAHSDTLSDMIASQLERYPKEIYSVMKQWNRSKNPWQRRLSLTSLLYYSTYRSYPLKPDKILPLIKARLDDQDIYVQKAVGWALRECGNCYPKETGNFIKKYVTDLSSIAFTTSTEKWSRKEKEPLKKKRKAFRKKK